MEAWSEWLLKSLVNRAIALELCSSGEIAVLLQDEVRPPAWWSLQLARSPQATARLIQLAGSAAFSNGSRVSDLLEAVEVLGHETARVLLFQEMLERMFPQRGREWLGVAARWRFLLALAASTAAVARSVGLAPGEVFVASLLHDLGRFILSRQGGEPYQRILAAYAASGDASALLEAEQAHLGFDHCMLAAAIAARLGLPSSIVSLLRDQHRLAALQDQLEGGTHLKRVATLELGRAVAEALGYGQGQEDSAVEGQTAGYVRLRALRANPANDVLKLNLLQLWNLQRQLETTIPALFRVARGSHGPLWPMLGPVARLMRSLKQEAARAVERLKSLRPERRPRGLPEPAAVAAAAPGARI